MSFMSGGWCKWLVRVEVVEVKLREEMNEGGVKKMSGVSVSVSFE